MAPATIEYRRVRKRIQRTMGYGCRPTKTLSLPLTEFAVDYFDKSSPFAYLKPETSASISRYGYADPCTLIVAMVYLDRLRLREKEFFESSNPADLYLPALILASKFLYDSDMEERAANSDWAACVEMDPETLNELEWDMAQKLDWQCMVKGPEFEKMLVNLERYVAANLLKKHGFCSYNELRLLSDGIESASYWTTLYNLFSLLGTASFAYVVTIASLFTAPLVYQPASAPCNVNCSTSVIDSPMGTLPAAFDHPYWNAPDIEADEDTTDFSEVASVPPAIGLFENEKHEPAEPLPGFGFAGLNPTIRLRDTIGTLFSFRGDPFDLRQFLLKDDVFIAPEEACMKRSFNLSLFDLVSLSTNRLQPEIHYTIGTFIQTPHAVESAGGKVTSFAYPDSMRVCVVGAGASGLPALKSCLENGLDAICYEKTSDLGGLWNYRPNVAGIEGTVMATTVVNTSKEMMAYSDYPPPAEWANFMHHSKVNEYLHQYADKFLLKPHINFNVSVTKIIPGGQGFTVDLSNGTTEYFDKVMLCTGHHAKPLSPELNGLADFKGRTLHAQHFRDTKGFENRNVFLVGIGNSALDIAVDLAKVAKSVTISTRRGTWVFNRVSRGGMPYDTIFMSRYYRWVMNTIPWTVANDFMEHVCNQRMDHDIYGLRPAHRFFQQHPTVNDALANLIAAGFITIADDVERIGEHSVMVKGGREFPCDDLIFCTGYEFGFDYLEGDLVRVENRRVTLYKYVFPVENDSLAVIGLIQPLGSIMPISEMQARWAVGVFTGKLQLPPRDEILMDIEKKAKEIQRRYFDSSKHTIQVDYDRYMDELAVLVGCMPPLKELLFSNPRLAMRFFMGPNAPYQYRIRGPNAWDGALEAFLTVGERVKKPLKNRECRTRRHKKRGNTDEWFRYASLKWCANWTIVGVVFGGLWLCAWPIGGFSALAYIISIAILSALLIFTHLWFDLQYDMSTCL
ncbi:unnamed protein product, partial [Mesorhabditis spiculigera]